MISRYPKIVIRKDIVVVGDKNWEKATSMITLSISIIGKYTNIFYTIFSWNFKETALRGKQLFFSMYFKFSIKKVLERGL